MTGHMIELSTETTTEKKVLSSTQLSNTAGLIFTTSEGQEVGREVMPSHQQEAMSSSLTVPPTFHQSESLPALTLKEMKALSRSDDVIDRRTNGKPASGYQAGVGMCDGDSVMSDSVRGDGVLNMKPLPSSKELLELRQQKKVRDLLAKMVGSNKRALQNSNTVWKNNQCRVLFSN